MAKNAVFGRDPYRRNLAPAPRPFSIGVADVSEMARLVDDACLAALNHPAKLDKRAEEYSVKLGALEAHLALAFRAANDLLQGLDELKESSNAKVIVER